MDTKSNNTKSIKTQVIDQLFQGYEFATQLQHLLDQNRIVSGLGSVSYDPDLVDELMSKILGSFNKTISVLDSFDPVPVPITVEGSWNASCGDDSVAPVSCNRGDSGESMKKKGGVGKGKRGCYTRKKKSHTRVVVASSSEDGYAWRKYGQKEIHNSSFPRSYFRCTHKPTQGCKAAKQVQKQEQDPEMYQITYIGYHTCTSSDQTHAKTEPFDHKTIMDLDNTPIPQNHVHAKIQEQEHNISSVTMVSSVKEEDSNANGDLFNCEGSSTDGDLSMVWDMMFNDHQQHYAQNQYYYNGHETSITSHHFGFIDDDQFPSFFK